MIGGAFNVIFLSTSKVSGKFVLKMALSTLNKKEISEFISSKCEDAKATAAKLLHAPEVCCMVESLTLFARSARPIDLRNENGNQKFLLLKNPESLNASVYQVTTAMQDVFRCSNFSMGRICLNLEKIPTYMNECLDALKNPDSSDSQEIIDWALPGINRATKICVDAAKEPYEKCVEALKLIQELQQAVLAARDFKNRRSEKNKEEMQDQIRLKEQNEVAMKELEAKLNRHKEIVESARDNYAKTLKNNNEISLTVFTMIMDGLNAFSYSASKIGQVVGASLINVNNKEPIMTKEELIKLFSEDEVLAQATEKALFNVIEEIVEQKNEELQANITEHIANLKCATDYKSSDKSGKMLRENGKQLMEALLKCKDNATEGLEKLNEAKTSAKLFLKTYQEAVEIKNKAKEDERQLKAEMSRERQNLMQTRADNLKVVQQDLDAASTHLNILFDKKESLSQAVNDAINKMAALNCEEIDLDEVLQCLEEVIAVLISIQIAYSDIVHYFNYVKELIDGPLVTQIQDITKFITDEDQTIKSLTDRQQRILLTEIIKACSLAYVLMHGSKFYKALSEKHIMPTLDNALRGNAITTEEAKKQKNEMPAKCLKIKYDVLSTVESQSMEVKNIYASLKKQGFDMNRAIEN